MGNHFLIIMFGGIYLEKEYDSFDDIFIDIYDQNYAYLVKYLFLLINDFSIAEDLAHDIFLRLYKSKNVSLDSPKLRNYIKKAARNIVIDYLKIKARYEAKNRKMIPVLKKLDGTTYSALESSVIEGEVISTVRDVLDEFPEKNRKIFISRMIDLKTRKQVAEEEKISAYIIKKIEHEIIHILKKKLKHFF